MPLPHRLPGTIPVGEISPRDSGAVPVDDALYNEAAITKRAAFTALIRWQKWFHSLPLCLRELRQSRTLRHTSVMLEHRHTISRHALGPAPSPRCHLDSLCFGRGCGQIGRAHAELQSRFDLVCRLLLEKKKNEKQTGKITQCAQ